MKQISTTFLQVAIVLISIVALALLLWEPHTEGVNAHATFFEVYNDPFIALVYTGSIPFFAALYQAFKVLGYARQDKVFSPEAVKALRTIRNCAIAIICFVVAEEAFIMFTHGNDDAAGAVSLGILITFGSLIVTASAIVFEWILQNGLDIKTIREVGLL